MGLISKTASLMAIPGRGVPGDRRRLWDSVFSSSGKESPGRLAEDERSSAQVTVRGMNMANSEAIKRLLEAMRSGAPGAPSDDRWEQTRHFTGINYVAIHRLSMHFSQAEYRVMIKDPNHPDGKRPVMPDDPPQGDRFCKPYDLVELLARPNRQDTFGKMMYKWSQQRRLTGTAYTWMVPNRLGYPFELYPVPTALVQPQAATDPQFPDGYYRLQPIYPYGPFSAASAPASAAGAAIPSEWMLRFQYPHPLLRYEGYAPQTGMRHHLDGIEAIDRARAYSMKRVFHPAAVLQFDEAEGAQPLNEAEIDRIRAELENAFSGPENYARLLVSTPGSRIEPWGANPVDMEYQSGWEQYASFILGGYGLTKPAAGMVEDSSYSTLFATLKQLDLITVQPECDDVAADLTRNVAPYFGDNLIVEIKSKRINDHEIKATNLGILIQGKAITKNELRRELEMPPMADPTQGEEIAGTDHLEQMMVMQQMQLAAQQAQMQQQAQLHQQGMDERQMTAEEQAALQAQAAQDEQGGAPTDMTRANPEEVEAARPRPGNLSRGSLGPRKALEGLRAKYKNLTGHNGRHRLNGVGV